MIAQFEKKVNQISDPNHRLLGRATAKDNWKEGLHESLRIKKRRDWVSQPVGLGNQTPTIMDSFTYMSTCASDLSKYSRTYAFPLKVPLISGTSR